MLVTKIISFYRGQLPNIIQMPGRVSPEHLFGKMNLLAEK